VIDLRALREAPEAVREALERRGDGAVAEALASIVTCDRRRRELVTTADAKKAERNAASGEIARLKQAGDDVAAHTAALRALSRQIKELDEALRAVEAELDERLLRLPNLPLPEVPAGGAEHNRVVREWGTPRSFDFAPKPHWQLGEGLGILDLRAGALVTGSGFPVLRGAGARLARALGAFMLDLHTREHGYEEVQAPYLVSRESMRMTGQVPHLEGDMYRTTDDLFLIPTGEVPLTNLHRGEILAADRLPIGYAGLTPCFRREAGAAGKDTRGLTRVHQFDKVELVRFCRPEDSPSEHERLTGHAEAVLRALELPYRVVLLAAGDLGFASAKTYDLEVWAPGMAAWLEVSSSSTFTDFQARRGDVRYRPRPDAKPEYVHTLNASGLAFPRSLIALLETYQEPDGSVRLPDPLAAFMGADRLHGPAAR